jgi:hypothetical protein
MLSGLSLKVPLLGGGKSFAFKGLACHLKTDPMAGEREKTKGATSKCNHKYGFPLRTNQLSRNSRGNFSGFLTKVPLASLAAPLVPTLLMDIAWQVEMN